MHNNTHTPNDTNKDSIFSSQKQCFSKYLFKNIASRYMVAIATNIPIQNCCRYVDMLKDTNSIAVVRKDKCKISGEIVEFLSTNPALFPKDNQLKLTL